MYTAAASDTDGVVFMVTDNEDLMKEFGLEDGGIVAVRDVSFHYDIYFILTLTFLEYF